MVRCTTTSRGPDVAGRQALVVEDVITTGGQVVTSTEKLRARGAEVDQVLCVIDRRPAVRVTPDLLTQLGLEVIALFRPQNWVARR
jgi:orotate phosphoribosyltransferase